MSEEQDWVPPALGPADYARSCVNLVVRGQRVLRAPDHPLFALEAACFVTLKTRGGLRGCVGTLAPAESDLGREIARNARSSAFNDPRFAPVQVHELDSLSCSVDVLSSSQACSFAELDPSQYGVIVSSGHRRGVLLPDLHGIDTPGIQVQIAQQKAGIQAGEPCDLERFCVTRCHEGESADSVLARIREGEENAASCDDAVDG